MEPKDYTKVALTLDNVIIPSERLRNTPSVRDGCPHDLEVDLRILGCEYIQKAGKCLRLPQVAMATAQVLFQRFFYSKSFVKFNMIYMAMACIFLAAKIEENCRRVRDVANVFHRLKQQGMGRTIEPMDYMGEEYFKVKASVIKYERFLLKELGFCVHVKHPHKLIIAYLQILESEKNNRLAQMAWNYMNDSLRTNVFVRFTPETIACACIFLSARKNKVPLPKSPPWWLVFDVSYEDMEAISVEILALYQKPKLFLIDLEKKLSTIKEAFCKKQVAIREVKLKKPAAASSDAPNATLSPAEREPTSSTDSPALVVQSKLLPSPSLSQPASQRSSPQHTNLYASPVTTADQIITNGGKAKNPVSPKGHKRQTTTSSPAPKRRKVASSSPDALPSPVLENSLVSEERVKPVISPIRVVSGDTSSEGTGSSPRENGIPEQYRQDFTKHKSRRSKAHRHRHHHRSSRPHDLHHHHRHQQSGRGREREEAGHDREREEVRERRDREDDRRRRDRPSSKVRRTELERYR